MQADRKNIVRTLNTAKGQINGILKMIEDDRYCLDIANQIMAAQALLKKANQEILTAHMRHCVKDAMNTEEAEEKIEEMIKVIATLLK